MDRSVPIVIASHRVLGATQKLRAKGFSTVLPFAALQILAPQVFPPHMFYDGWLKDVWENKDQYRWLGGALGDDRSRQVLDAVLNYRISADPEFLAPALDKGRYHQGLYHPVGLFECDEHEVYVDAGAFDGDSLTWFKERVANRYDRIIAFEPDPKTYARLTEEFQRGRSHSGHQCGLASQESLAAVSRRCKPRRHFYGRRRDFDECHRA